EPGRAAGLNEPAKEEFFDQAGFDEQPNEGERDADDELSHAQFATANRGGAEPKEILECQDRAAENYDDSQVISFQGAEPFPLQSEIAPAVAEKKSEHRKRDRNEHDQFPREYHEKFSAGRGRPARGEQKICECRAPN